MACLVRIEIRIDEGVIGIAVEGELRRIEGQRPFHTMTDGRRAVEILQRDVTGEAGIGDPALGRTAGKRGLDFHPVGEELGDAERFRTEEGVVVAAAVLDEVAVDGVLAGEARVARGESGFDEAVGVELEGAALYDGAAGIDHVEAKRNAVEFALPVALLDDEAELRGVAGAVDAAVGEDEGREGIGRHAAEARGVEAGEIEQAVLATEREERDIIVEMHDVGDRLFLAGEVVQRGQRGAAAVIGSRFSREILETLGIDPVLQDLVAGEFIDQIRFTGQPEYVFHHPLIRAVAYESQLKSDRGELHRRVAAAVESGDRAAADENASLIAEHLEAAGDGRAAYGWHMRAATWATNRDPGAARLSWERAVRIADALPAEDPDRAAMRIAPRTMLCGIAWRVHINLAGGRFDELRELCAAAGDKASLAIAMAGLVIDHAFRGRMREASRLASEHVALVESIGDSTLTVGLSFGSIYVKMECAEWNEVLRWSQRVIDLADGDPLKGNFLGGSPLAAAYSTRGVARYCLGRAGWRDDLREGLAMARSADPLSYARCVIYAYGLGIPMGVLKPDDHAMREIEDALRIAERSSDNSALTYAQIPLGLALVHRPTAAERDRGHELLAAVSKLFLRGDAYNLSEQPIVNIYWDRERARRGHSDDAIRRIRAATDHLALEGQLLAWGIPATGVLVETLLGRGTEEDLAEAEFAIERLAATPTDGGLALRDIWLLRLRALLAQASGDEAGYREYRNRYRNTAKTPGFEGHIAWAEAMP